jgi:hypothetical protein
MTNRETRSTVRPDGDEPIATTDPSRPMGSDSGETTGYGTAASGADVTGNRGTQASGEGSDVEGEETDEFGSSGAPGNPV